MRMEPNENASKRISLTQHDGNNVLEDASGQQYWPNDEFLRSKLEKVTDELKFKAKYIRQAYGKDGSRNAIDRLLKHETLQKIDIRGVPEGYRLTILMLAIQPAIRVYTINDPITHN